MQDVKRKNIIHYGIQFLLLINGLGALISGLKFIVDPSGITMGLSKSILTFSTFDSFLIPGIILFLFNGVSSILVLWKVFRRKATAAYWLVAQGILSTGWIVVQVILLRSFTPLHLVFGLIGILFLSVGFQYIKIERRTQRK